MYFYTQTHYESTPKHLGSNLYKRYCRENLFFSLFSSTALFLSKTIQCVYKPLEKRSFSSESHLWSIKHIRTFSRMSLHKEENVKYKDYELNMHVNLYISHSQQSLLSVTQFSGKKKKKH